MPGNSPVRLSAHHFHPKLTTFYHNVPNKKSANIKGFLQSLSVVGVLVLYRAAGVVQGTIYSYRSYK